jgi:hypothetical protein
MKMRTTEPVEFSNSSLKGKFIAMSTHIRKVERSQINNLMTDLKLLEKHEQDNPKSKRQKGL